MRAVDIIQKKRDGLALNKEEIEWLIEGYVSGTVPDYQMSAFAMAVYFKGMTTEEISHMTMKMVQTGQQFDLSAIPGIKVDKHSTGGVGDKVTLVLVPLVASFGVPVAKMSGRGLGHTGGTIDKLESIKGFQIERTQEEFIQQVQEIGLSVIGQSDQLVKADKLLYALRDVTATVDTIPLIASSVMSKKLAGGADAIVLDVKYGSGAFMKTKERAFELARAMVDIGVASGKPTTAVLTSMNAPLGMSIGNSLEIDEAVDVLSGRGGKRLKEVVLTVGAYMLKSAGLVATAEEGRTILQEHINDGSGLQKFKEFLEAQGGDTSFIGVRPLTKRVNARDVRAEKSGFIVHVDGRALGEIAMETGAGRAHKDDVINLYTGLALHKEVYDKVEAGDLLCTLYGGEGADTAAYEERIRAAFQIEAAEPKEKEAVVAAVIDG